MSVSTRFGARDDEKLPRGLATLAMLKTQYDEGKDHLGLFEPFVRDAAGRIAEPDFAAVDVQATIREAHGISLPVDTIQTLLGRMVRTRELRREAGRYFKTGSLPISDLVSRRKKEEELQSTLAAAFREFAGRHGEHINDNDVALARVIDFISSYDVPLSLAGDLSGWISNRDAGVPSHHKHVALFIAEACRPSPELTLALQSLLEGFVLQNVLTLKDVTRPEQNFDNLLVLLDASVAFSLLGLVGDASALATREFLDLLRSVRGVPQVLDKTVAEMQRILTVYEERLGTLEGRLSLYQTDLTRYFLTSKWTPSDVKELSATLDVRLGKYGVAVRPSPKRERDFTLDEEALGAWLSRDKDGPLEHRVIHDVDCVAAVLTIRQGRTENAVERSRAIFVTTSGIVVRNVQKWYADQGQFGIPPIIHQLALSNVVWLKRPVNASKLKLHELIALSRSVLAPSRKTWAAFVKHLERLRTEGVVSSDETVAVIASGLTDSLLMRIDDDVDPDSSTIGEVIDRVRSSYRAEADEMLERERVVARTEVERVEKLARDAESSAVAERDRRTQMESRGDAIAQRTAKTVRIVLEVLAAALLASSILLAFPGAQDLVPAWLRGAVWVITSVAAVLAFWGGYRGASITQLGERVEGAVRDKIRNWLGIQ